MCRCCQDCLESCYWHLIEERFCFDNSIALYEEPVKKDEKNNNMFDNMAFYDSVSVIAGRAIVTIDPIPSETKPIIQQPTKRLKWSENSSNPKMYARSLSKSVPVIYEDKSSSESAEEETLKGDTTPPIEAISPKSLSTSDVPKKLTLDPSTLETQERTRKKSLRERRMSKSLYLKIDGPKEVPIIRQQSMPKFYLDTPEEHQTDSAFSRLPSSVLTSPVINKQGRFDYDLYSVVQMEKSRSFHVSNNPVPVHSSEQQQHSKLSQIREKLKLHKSKSTANALSLAGGSKGNTSH